VGKTYKPKNCQNCGELFTPTGATNTWCESCRTVSCQVCGKKIITSPSRIKSGQVKFCSKECMLQGRAYPEYEIVCPGCGKTFTSQRKHSKYCLECRTITCATCGKPIVVRSKFVGKAKYCSVECHDWGQRGREWSEQDIEFLKNNYPYSMRIRELAEHFEVSESTINRMVKKLVIYRAIMVQALSPNRVHLLSAKLGQ